MTRALFVLTSEPAVRERWKRGLTDRFPEIEVDVIDHPSKFGPDFANVDIILAFSYALADHIVAGAPNLKWIQVLGTGVDTIVDLPSLRPEVIVTNIVGIHGGTMSEAALSAMLCLSRHIPEVVRNQDRRQWDRRPSQVLEGKVVGILGVGAIAAALAPRCKALGMEVVGISSAPRSVAGFDRMFSTAQIVDAVRTLDHFVLLTPYSPATRHLVGEAVLAAMKPKAYLINLARGGVVDESALLNALERNTIAGAALDVFETEPLPRDHPFWALPNVLLTPHLGGFFDGYPECALPTIEANMRRFLAGDHAGLVNRITRSSTQASSAG